MEVVDVVVTDATQVDAQFYLTWFLQVMIAAGVIMTAVSSIVNRRNLTEIKGQVEAVKVQVDGRMDQMLRELQTATTGQATAEGNLAGRVAQTEERRVLANASGDEYNVHVTNDSIPVRSVDNKDASK